MSDATPDGAVDPFAPIGSNKPLRPKAAPEVWEPQLPAPGEPPEQNAMRHPKYGEAVGRWVYRNAAGAPLFAVGRFDHVDAEGMSAKEFMPFSFGHRVWTTKAGNRLDKIQWHMKAPPEPRALYGLDRLAARPDALVVLVEGEKKTHAAEKRFPGVVSVAAMNGAKSPAKSDWTALAGRHVVIWPDADEPGLGFASLAADLMHEAGAASVRVVDVPVGVWPIKWDLADADLPEGVTEATLRDLLDTAPLTEADNGTEQDQPQAVPEQAMADMARLAALSDVEYSKARRDAAAGLSINLRDLDAVVKGERQRQHKASLSAEAVTAEVDRLSRLPKSEYARERSAAAQALLIGVLDLDAAIGAEKTKRRAAAEAEHRAKPAPEKGETRWPLGILPCPDGLYADTGGDAGPVFLCGPIEVLGEGRDASGEGWSKYLKWHDRDGRCHQWAMPNRLLTTQPGELEAVLMDKGLDVSPDAAAKAQFRIALAGVRSGSRVTLADAPGWSAPGDGPAAYVLVSGETVGSPAEAIVLRSPPENASIKTKQAGTLEGWQKNVAAKAVGNPVAVFSICMAFAGPLLKPLGESSGGVHFFGRSKAGKTLTMRMGVSVLGPPRKDGPLRDWRSTANALEGAAEESNDGFLTLDEIHQAEPKEVVGAVYQLANESGKGRLSRDAISKRRRTWQVMVESCGEVDVATIAAKHSSTPLPAGADVRLPSVPIDGRDMWPNLHGYKSALDLMTALQHALVGHFGVAIRPFLTQLAGVLATADGTLEQVSEELRLTLYGDLPEGADPQVREVARRCALIALAGELATEWGVLPWEAGEATLAARTVMGWWLGRRGTAGATEESQHVRTVRAYLSEYGSARFVALNWEHEHGQAGRWVERQPDRLIQSRTGWRRACSEGDGDEYLIDRDGWQKMCADSGADPAEVAKTLSTAGHLATGDGKNLAKRVRLPNVGSIRCYVVKPSIFVAAESESTQGKAA